MHLSHLHTLHNNDEVGVAVCECKSPVSKQQAFKTHAKVGKYVSAPEDCAET